MKKSVELNEFVEEIKDILDNVVNPITKVIEIEDDSVEKSIILTDEEISKTYESENEDEDKHKKKSHKKTLTKKTTSTPITTNWGSGGATSI